MIRKPYKVYVCWDEGDAENGPSINGFNELVFAKNKEDAEAFFKEEYTGCDIYAKLADKDYIEEKKQEWEDERAILELEWYLENYEIIIAGYTDAEKDLAIERINFESDFHSWQDVYKVFLSLNDDDAIFDFYRKGRGNNYFERAWIEWNTKPSQINEV